MQTDAMKNKTVIWGLLARGDLGTCDGIFKLCSGGLIPALVRQTIRDVASKFDSVFILAETTALQIESKAAPIPVSLAGDPLVIGWKKGAGYQDEGQFFLISKFDTTTLEAYIADEFAHKPIKALAQPGNKA